MITLTNPKATLYFLAYGAAFAVMLFFFLWEGRRRNYPFLPLLLIFLSGLLFLLAGSRLGTYDLENWRQLIAGNSLPAGRAQTSLTAVLGGIIGIVLAKRLLGFRHPVADCFAFALPAAMIFIRSGCLLAGCCYGLPAAVPWSINYTSAFPVFQHQLNEGLIGPQALYSLGVHPVPVYFIVLAVITFVLLYRFRNNWKAKGSLFLFSLLLLTGGRFFIEFFRDPVTNHQLGELFLGLKIVQWILLVFAAGIGIALHVRGKHLAVKTSPKRSYKESLPQMLLLFFVLSLLTGALLEWMNWEVKLILGMSLYIIAIILAIRIFREITAPAYRRLTLGLLVVALLCTAQVAPESERVDFKRPAFLHTITGGMLTGNISPVGYETVESTGCDDPTTSHFDQIGPQFATLGVQYEMEKRSAAENFWRMGIGYHSTTYDFRRDGIDANLQRRRAGALRFYSGWGFKEGAIDIGFQAGNFQQADGRHLTTAIIPVGRLRLGPMDKMYFEAGVGDDFPYGVFGTYYHFGAGMNIDWFRQPGPHLVDFTLRAGANNMGEVLGAYLSPELQISRFLLRPTARFGAGQPHFGVTAGVQLGKMPDH